MRKLLLCLPVLLASLAWSQNHCMGVNPQMCTNYTTTPTFTFADNLPYAKTHNVWHVKTGAPALAGFVSEVDSTAVPKHYGWTSAGQVWEYVDPAAATNPNTWVQHPEMGTAIKGLALAAGTLWSNQSTTHCSGFGSNYFGIFKWTGSAWTQPWVNSCETDFGAATDGTLMKISSGNVYYSVDDGVTWIHPTIVPGAAWVHIRPVSVYKAVITKTDNTVWSLIPSTGVLTSLPGVTTTKSPAVDQSGNTYVIGTDSFVYHLNASGTWDKLLGSGYTNVNTCGMFCTYATTASGLYQLPDFSMTATLSLTGNTVCTPSCPPGTVHHTGTSHFKFQNASAGGQTTTGADVYPTAEIGPVNASDTTTDPIWCMENPIACADNVTQGTVLCSIVGSIFASGLFGDQGFHTVRAETRQDDGFHGTLFGETFPECGPIGPKKCAYNGYKACKYTQFNYYCIGGTLSPDYKENYITDCATTADGHSEPPGLWGFDTKAICSYYNNQKIYCAETSQDPLYAVQVPFGTRGACTFNQEPQW